MRTDPDGSEMFWRRSARKYPSVPARVYAREASRKRCGDGAGLGYRETVVADRWGRCQAVVDVVVVVVVLVVVGVGGVVVVAVIFSETGDSREGVKKCRSALLLLLLHARNEEK